MVVQLKTAPELVVSHWHQFLETLNAVPTAFYDSIEAAVKSRCVPDITVSRVEYQESGFASAKRQYLHIARGHLVFDICAAPFGSGFFVSYWLAQTKPTLPGWFRFLAVVAMLLALMWAMDQFGFLWGIFFFSALMFGALGLVRASADDAQQVVDFVSALPIIGWIYERIFTAPTYYAHDTTIMFQEAVHNSVMQAMDGLTSQHGLRTLTDGERKPIQTDFFRRRAA